MILLIHVLAGLTAAETLKDPASVFVVASASHAVLDSLPHWNYPVPRPPTLRTFLPILPDLIPSGLLVLLFLALDPGKWPLLLLGTTGAVWFDFLTLFDEVPTIKRILRVFYRFHGHIQREVPFLTGVFVQASVTALFLILITIFR